MTSPETNGAIRTVVVDDEALAREELIYLLGQVGGVEVVGQAANGLDAIEIVDESHPDLVMLDIQMPGLGGFEVARRLIERDADPHIVFVTAFDRHAIEAFEINAVDYLLKPVEAERLGMAIDRVRRRMQTDRPSGRSGPTNGGAPAWALNSRSASQRSCTLPAASVHPWASPVALKTSNRRTP